MAIDRSLGCQSKMTSRADMESFLDRGMFTDVKVIAVSTMTMSLKYKMVEVLLMEYISRAKKIRTSI